MSDVSDVSDVSKETAQSTTQPDEPEEAATPTTTEESEDQQTGMPPIEGSTPAGDGTLTGRSPEGEASTGQDDVSADAVAVDAVSADAVASGDATLEVEVEDKPAEGPAAEDAENKVVEDNAVRHKTVHRTREVARGGVGDRRQAVKRYWPFAVMGLCTLVLGVGIYLALDSAKEEPAPPAQTAPTKTPPEQLEKFSDQQGGFSLSYPKSWRSIPIPPEGSDLRLVLSTAPPAPGGAPDNPNPTGDDGMWVRVVPPNQVEQKYTDFAAEIKGLTEDKPCGTEGSACLRQEQVSVAGMNGVRFIYTIPDTISGQNAIHVQYFLRRNQQGNLYVIVFQAVPTSDLAGLAPTFDEVVATFQAA